MVKDPENPGDDTAILRSALAKGGHIKLEQGRVYHVSAGPNERAALLIGPHTFLDLNGATLVLAPGPRCSLIAQRPSEPVQQVQIANGTLVGNGQRQPADYDPGIGITPTVYLRQCNDLTLKNLVMRDTYMYALYTAGEGGIIDNLDIDGAIGGGVHVTGSRWIMDKIRVRNVTFFERVNCQGNPFIVSLRDSRVGAIYCENYGFGVKFQDGCENLEVKSIEALAGPNNDDYLVKIQGSLSSTVDHPNRHVNIGTILAKNGPMSGLYIYHSKDIRVGSYRGVANGRSRPPDTKNGADVLLIDADNIHFVKLEVNTPTGVGVWLHEKTGKVSADAFTVTGAAEPSPPPVVIRAGVALLGGVTYALPEAAAKP